MTRGISLSFASALSAAAIFAAAGVAMAEEDSHTKAGRALFQQYCGACHGVNADGNGPMASTLTPRPADLTRIAARRGGVFPDAAIQRIIDGRDPLVAHGRRGMPVWGRVFGEALEPGLEREAAVRGDMQLLLAFLKSVQIRE